MVNTSEVFTVYLYNIKMYLCHPSRLQDYLRTLESNIFLWHNHIGQFRPKIREGTLIVLRRLPLVVLVAFMGGFLPAGCDTAAPPPDGTAPTTAVDGYTRAQQKIKGLPGELAKRRSDPRQLKEYLARQGCEVDGAIENGSWDKKSAGQYYDELVEQYNLRFNPDNPQSTNTSGLTAAEAKYCGELSRVKNVG